MPKVANGICSTHFPGCLLMQGQWQRLRELRREEVVEDKLPVFLNF